MPEGERVCLKLPKRSYNRLVEIRSKLKHEHGRRVTFGEVLEVVLDAYEHGSHESSD